MTNNKRKIIYCITKANLGGAQKYIYDLATSLPPDLFDVIILSGTDGPLIAKLRDKKLRIIILGSLIRNVNIFKDFWSFFKLLKIFHLEKPDIIHLNSSKMGLLGSIAGRLTGIKKIIFTGHGWAFNEDRGKIQKIFIHLLHLLTIVLSHMTIAVSEETKRQVSNNKYIQSKITVIRNGLDQIDFLDKNQAREEILRLSPALSNLEKAGLSPNHIWLGTISELHKNKGLKYLIEAIHLLDIASDNRSTLPTLIIIGDGEIRQKLQEKINRYNLQNNIFMIGQLEKAQKYLKAFDIFTLTSITEALPYVILEAGQAGLPIIASRVGGIPEIITDMENGILIKPKDSDQIKETISFFLEDPEKMTILGHNLAKKISADFTKNAMVNKTIKMYN